MRPAVKRAIKHFIKTTTLHGFKYLSSPFYIDRILWVFCCCAGACCAGLLCAVLWARFLQVPSLLALLDSRHVASIGMPDVAVCPSPQRLGQLFEEKMSIDEQHNPVHLPALFSSLLRRKPLKTAHLVFLEHVLATHNLSLAEALIQITEPCQSLVRACRWLGRPVPCEQLFRKKTTAWGVCCVASTLVLNANTDSDMLVMNPTLDLVLQCSDGSIPSACEFFTKFPGEEWISPVELATGYNYMAQLTFTAIKDSSKEKLVDGNCESSPDYSRRKCFVSCKERKCKCSDPLQAAGALPACTLRTMNCLRNFKLIEESCSCLLGCRRISTHTSLAGGPLSQLEHTFDPLFSQANATSTVVSVRVIHSDSEVFDLVYTETWWSLLSSLGGVFNMFLGVGLFSALELIFFIVERLPAAIRRSTELPVPEPQCITVTAAR